MPIPPPSRENTEIELAPTSVLAGRDTELVPYKIEPVMTSIMITESRKMARAQ